jgi:hypothetical protein
MNSTRSAGGANMDCPGGLTISAAKDWIMVGFSIKLNNDALTNDIVYQLNSSNATGLKTTTTSANRFH